MIVAALMLTTLSVEEDDALLVDYNLRQLQQNGQKDIQSDLNPPGFKIYGIWHLTADSRSKSKQIYNKLTSKLLLPSNY